MSIDLATTPSAFFFYFSTKNHKYSIEVATYARQAVLKYIQKG